MYDPFNDYFGLSGLLSRVESNGECDHLNQQNNDFNTNGVNVPLQGTTSACTWLDSNNNTNISPSTTTTTTGFLPLPLKLSDITELSRVMQNRGKNRGGGRAGGSSGVNGRPPIVSWCVFCKNNGESELVYGSHKLKSEDGLTTCPILRAYTCPLCGTNGDHAHTIKYCPLNKEATSPDGTVNGPGTIGQGSQYRTPRTSTGRRRASSITNGLY